MKDWIKIETYSNEQVAVLKKDLLQEHGIEAVLLSKRDSSYPSIGAIELYCHLTQAHQALEIISDENY